jgi:hypothetical protein
MVEGKSCDDRQDANEGEGILYETLYDVIDIGHFFFYIVGFYYR